MLTGIIIWTIVHLSVNPDRSSVMLFGSFLVFSVLSIITSEIRGKNLSGGTTHFKFDMIAIIIGVISFALLYRFHEGLFGVSLS